jgi:hypothetical protein
VCVCMCVCVSCFVCTRNLNNEVALAPVRQVGHRKKNMSTVLFDPSYQDFSHVRS